MKRGNSMLGRVIGAALVLSALLLTPAYGRTYTDDMSEFGSDSIRTYQNLIPITNSRIPVSVQNDIFGKFALTFASQTPIGFAEYRIQGAQTLTVGIYTRHGTFVSVTPREGYYVLGMFQENMGHLASQQIQQAKYHRGSGLIYANFGGTVLRLLDIPPYLRFVESPAGTPELIDYGLNVYAASDSGGFSQVPLRMSTQSRITGMVANWSGAFVYEQLQYAIPQSATRVRVEINDYRFMDAQISEGVTERRPPATGMRTVLSYAAFSGEDLILGVPEPMEGTFRESSEASSGSSEDKKSSSSSKKSSASGKKSTAASSPGAAATQASSTSKFVGEVTSIPPSSKARSEKSSASKDSGDSESSRESREEDSSSQPEELVQVYRMEPKESDGRAVYIYVYIVLVLALILLLLLRGKKR